MPKKDAVQAEINIGMIGHVDHGKTSLTKQLTGTWTDTHSEELKRGISIRLGYADIDFRKCEKCKGAEAYTTKEKCENCGGKTKLLRKVSFVDAPGHETLMTIMLTGASLMQGAILVISANEKCPQPRTKEHLMALNIGGIKNIVVAQNKIDLVDKKQAMQNHKEIQDFLKEFGYTKTPIIPTSAHFGTNIDLLIEAIEQTIPTPKYDLQKPLKMLVARSFDINKPGTLPEDLKGGVLGGSILQGTIKEGDEIEISPGMEEKPVTTKVIELNCSEGRLKEAKPGGLIAVRTTLDPGLSRGDRMRGQTIGTKGKLPLPVKEVDLTVEMLKRIVEKKDFDLRAGGQIVLSAGTSTAVGTISKKLSKNEFKIVLKNSLVLDKNEKVAISKRDKMTWRLIAYGIKK